MGTAGPGVPGFPGFPGLGHAPPGGGLPPGANPYNLFMGQHGMGIKNEGHSPSSAKEPLVTSSTMMEHDQVKNEYMKREFEGEETSFGYFFLNFFGARLFCFWFFFFLKRRNVSS